MERTGTQYRVVDLLLATSLIGIYLAGMVCAIQHLKPGELRRESLGLVATLAVFIATLELTIRFARRCLRPHLFCLTVAIPWAPLFVAFAFLFVVALCGAWLMDGAFFVLSIPVVSLTLMVLTHRNAHANPNGLLFLSLPWLWTQMDVTQLDDDTLRIRLRPSWLCLTIDVRSSERESVLALMANARAAGDSERPIREIADAKDDKPG